MGRLIERDLDGEMMAKIKVLFGEALESVKKDYPTIPSFGFEQIVDSLDENDHLTKDIFNFLVYEAAQRHRAAHPNEAFPRPATIHHYLPQNSIPSVSSPSSSPSNSLSTSLSSLAFSSRLLRNQQLVRSLLSEGDETELGSALENTSLWQLNSVQNVSVRESNGMSSSVAIAAPTSPNSAHGSAFRLGRRTLTRSSDQGLDDDSDGEEEDDYIISQTRRELRDLDVAFPARVATQAEMRSRQAAAEVFPEASPYRPFRSLSSSLVYIPVSPRASSLEWSSGLARRHGISAPLPLPGDGAVRSNDSDTLTRQRRLQFVRQRWRAYRGQQQSPTLSRPASVPAGSLIPNDNGFRISQASATTDFQPTLATPTQHSSGSPWIFPTSSLSPSVAPPGASGAESYELVMPPEPQPNPSQQTSSSQPFTHDQTRSRSPSLSAEVYHEFVDAAHRSRAAMRAANLVMGEIQSMRRRTLNVVDRFVSILDDTEQTSVGHATFTAELHEPPSAIAQPLTAAIHEAGNITLSTLQSEAQSVSGHSANSGLNQQTTMEPGIGRILPARDLTSPIESALAVPSHSSSIPPLGQSQQNPLNCS